MAKIYYNQKRKQFEVAACNPITKRVEVIDSDTDLNALGIRQGFFSEDNEEESDDGKKIDE